MIFVIAFAVLLIVGLFGQYIILGLGIIFGNKDAMQDCHSLCKDDLPWKEKYWTSAELKKPGEETLDSVDLDRIDFSKIK